MKALADTEKAARVNAFVEEDRARIQLLENEKIKKEIKTNQESQTKNIQIQNNKPLELKKESRTQQETINKQKKTISLELKNDEFNEQTITNNDDEQLLQKISDIKQLQRIIKNLKFTNDDVTLLNKYYKNAILFYQQSLNYNSQNSWDYPFIKRKENFDIDQLMQKLEDKKKMIETRIKLLENDVKNPMHEESNINIVSQYPVIKDVVNEEEKESSINLDDIKVNLVPDENVNQEDVAKLKLIADSENDKRLKDIIEQETSEKRKSKEDEEESNKKKIEYDNEIKEKDEKIAENEMKIKNLETNQALEKKEIDKITQENLNFSSENKQMVSELTQIKETLSQNEKEKEKLNTLINTLKAKNVEVETNQKELLTRLIKIQTDNGKREEAQKEINKTLKEEKVILETELKKEIQVKKNFKYNLDENVKETIQIKKNISEIWKNIEKKCVELNGKCDILEKWTNNKSPLESLTSLKNNLNKLFESTQTQIKQLKGGKMEADKKIEDVLLERTKIASEHNKEIQSKTKEKDQLKNQIISLTTDIETITKERDAFKTELMTNLLNNQDKIVVSLDKELFYKDICKNIKNIIINASFLDMLFDELLKAYPEPNSSPNTQEIKGKQMSPADKERQTKITGMKSKISSARDFLYTFLQDLVTKLNLDSEVLTGVQPIDDTTRTALGSNMAAYLFAASFFPLIGGISNGKRNGKTLKSLGLHNKKQTKSLRTISMSMIMKGGIDSQDKPKLEDLVTKVIADICQQMELTENLLKYISDASLEMNTFNLSLIEFKTVYQERKGSNKKEVESVTNFLVPYKESTSDNPDVQQIKNEIELFLRERQEKRQQSDAKLEEVVTPDLT